MTATNAEPKLTLALIRMIEEISERCMCAGWDINIECRIWEIINGGEPRYGMCMIEQREIDALKALSWLISGWVRYGDDGPEYVGMEPWAEHFNAWAKLEARR